MNQLDDRKRGQAVRRAIAYLISFSLVWSLIPTMALAQMVEESAENPISIETEPTLEIQDKEESTTALSDADSVEEKEDTADQIQVPAQQSGLEVKAETGDPAAGGLDSSDDSTAPDELLQARVEDEVSRVREIAGEQADAAMLVKVWYERLATAVVVADADSETENSNDFDPVLKGEPATQAAIADLFCRVAQRLGVDCVSVVSDNDSLVVWNMVKIDGEYYHVDSASAARAHIELAKRSEKSRAEIEVPGDWLLVSDDAIRALDPGRISWHVLAKDEGASDSYAAAKSYEWESFDADSVDASGGDDAQAPESADYPSKIVTEVEEQTSAADSDSGTSIDVLTVQNNDEEFTSGDYGYVVTEAGGVRQVLASV